MQGETALAQYTFSNGLSLVICGNLENHLYTEFDVFSCKTGESLSRYSAIQKCRIEFKNDTLKIIELKFIPSGENWAWQYQAIAIEFISLNSEKSLNSLTEPAFSQLKTSIPESVQEEFLDNFSLKLKNGERQDWQWEELIAKLEVIALSGNQRAIELLINLGDLSNNKLSGADKEQYYDALATLEWIGYK